MFRDREAFVGASPTNASRYPDWRWGIPSRARLREVGGGAGDGPRSGRVVCHMVKAVGTPLECSRRSGSAEGHP